MLRALVCRYATRRWTCSRVNTRSSAGAECWSHAASVSRSSRYKMWLSSASGSACRPSPAAIACEPVIPPSRIERRRHLQYNSTPVRVQGFSKTISTIFLSMSAAAGGGAAGEPRKRRRKTKPADRRHPSARALTFSWGCPGPAAKAGGDLSLPFGNNLTPAAQNLWEWRAHFPAVWFNSSQRHIAVRRPYLEDL